MCSADESQKDGKPGRVRAARENQSMRKYMLAAIMAASALVPAAAFAQNDDHGRGGGWGHHQGDGGGRGQGGGHQFQLLFLALFLFLLLRFVRLLGLSLSLL